MFNFKNITNKLASSFSHETTHGKNAEYTKAAFMHIIKPDEMAENQSMRIKSFLENNPNIMQNEPHAILHKLVGCPRFSPNHGAHHGGIQWENKGLDMINYIQQANNGHITTDDLSEHISKFYAFTEQERPTPTAAQNNDSVLPS